MNRLPTKEEWIKYAVDEADRQAGVPRYALGPNMDEIMRLADLNAIESEPTFWLQYYSANMAFYASEAYIYRAALDILESRYETNIQRFVASSQGAVARNLMHAKATYADLFEAASVLRNRLGKVKAELDTATSYRDLVSRTITHINAQKQITQSSEKW